MAISDNLTILRKTIPAAVRLIAVSKRQSVAAIQSAIAAGQTDFAENYAQEFRDKVSGLHAEGGHRDPPLQNKKLCWHFIGHLQSNKAKYVVGRAEFIHSLDRLSLAKTIQKLASEQGIIQKCLIEVKLSTDTNKTGCAEEDVRQLLAALRSLPNIDVVGLMTVASLHATEEETRSEFRKLRTLRDELGLRELSMGMSHDYEIALAEGATMLRIGSKVFGERI